MTHYVGDNPDQKSCSICGINRALTGEGRLFAFAVRAPKNTLYIKRICEDCVTLFNARHWSRTKKLLMQVKTEKA